jgi:hypothetical protein
MIKNVIDLTRRPITATPTTTPQGLDTMAAHQEAENALAMALHYLRSSASNIPGATRKAVQALGALKRLHMPGHAVQTPAPDGAGAHIFASLEG